jgi:ribosomal protein S18 acetylase RimI-like enzyme
VSNHTFRPASECDRDWVWKTKKLCLSGYVKQTFGEWDEDAQSARFHASFNTQEIQIISLDDQDIGYIAVAHNEHEIRLFNIMILPDFQNHGLGTAVMGELLSEARVKQIPLRLQVLKVNPARNFYARLGFKVNGENNTHFQMSWTA